MAADSILATGEFERAHEAKQSLVAAQHALERKDAAAALTLAARAEALNPGFYQNAALRGRALLLLGQRAEAAQAFEAALVAQPAFLKERHEIAGWLQSAQNPH